METSTKTLSGFRFRITGEEALRYREATGFTGRHLPLGLAMKFFADASFVGALREAMDHHDPIHVQQHYDVSAPLETDVDYDVSVSYATKRPRTLEVTAKFSVPGHEPQLVMRSVFVPAG